MTSHTIRPRTAEGDPIVSPTTVYSPEDGVVEGVRRVATLDAQNVWDKVVGGNGIYLQGGSFWTRNATDGDYGELAVVDKDDVLGLFQYYGLQPGEVLELRKHVRTYYFPEGGFNERIEFETKSFIPAGLYLREIYLSTATSGAAPILAVNYKFYEV